ncbi:hypothetical protein ACQPW3_25545 [Actinosynnema sp. CA-248983]
MTSLFPHQLKILECLRDPDLPSHGLLTAPIGSGLRRPVVIRLAEVTTHALALVVCDSRAMVQQWALLLREEGASVLVLDSAQAALEFIERRPLRPTGVLVATYQRLADGPSSRILEALTFELVVLDGLRPGMSDRLERLSDQARRLVGLVSGRPVDPVYVDWPIVWQTTYGDLVKSGHTMVRDVPYELTSEERAVKEAAIAVLRDDAYYFHRFMARGDSLPVLHAELLALASDADKGEFAERAWPVLDLMEAMQTVDSRLSALDGLVRQVTEQGGRCVVMAYSRTDVRYIADHLADAGRSPSGLVDVMTPPPDRLSALRALEPGNVLVATTALCESADQWPSGTTVVLWPSPAGLRRVPSELSLVLEARPDIVVYALRDVEKSDE